MDIYEQWMLDNVPQTYEGQRAQCTKYTPIMSKAFPELTVCRGVVYSMHDLDRDKQYPHMWLRLANRIIDPTVSQFRQLGTLVYEEWPQEVDCMHKCLNCGKYFHGQVHYPSCSLECSDEMVQWMQSDRKQLDF